LRALLQPDVRRQQLPQGFFGGQFEVKSQIRQQRNEIV